MFIVYTRHVEKRPKKKPAIIFVIVLDCTLNKINNSILCYEEQK
jgi:hypothetical protein